jgi:hypothetical protein
MACMNAPVVPTACDITCVLTDVLQDWVGIAAWSYLDQVYMQHAELAAQTLYVLGALHTLLLGSPATAGHTPGAA